MTRFPQPEINGMTGSAARWTWRAVVVALLGAAAGCNWLTPLAVVGEHKQRVYAEYDKLPDQRVVVLLWTPPESLFDYPYLRFELSNFAADELVQGLSQAQHTIDLVDPRDVEDYLQSQLDTRIDPAEVGRHFHADCVVYLELLQFQLRDPHEPQFLQGQAEASVAVHDLTEGDEGSVRYELTPVRVSYPQQGKVVFSATNALLVRESTYRLFSEELAQKFYDHSIDM